MRFAIPIVIAIAIWLQPMFVIDANVDDKPFRLAITAKQLVLDAAVVPSSSSTSATALSSARLAAITIIAAISFCAVLGLVGLILRHRAIAVIAMIGSGALIAVALAAAFVFGGGLDGEFGLARAGWVSLVASVLLIVNGASVARATAN